MIRILTALWPMLKESQNFCEHHYIDSTVRCTEETQNMSCQFLKAQEGTKRALFKRALCSLPDFWPWPPHAPLPCLLSLPLLSIASLLSELKWASTRPKKIQAMHQRCAPAEWSLREISRFSHRFWREVLVKFSVAHPNPGKRSTENFTKISRQISRHLWQRKRRKISLPHFCRVAALTMQEKSRRTKCTFERCTLVTPWKAAPKGPFRTKNATAPESVVRCYRHSFSLTVPFSHSPYWNSLSVVL